MRGDGSVRNYLTTTIDGMAKGLFASLIVGVIVKQIGIITDIDIIIMIGQLAQYLMGACIGAGIAFTRKSGQFTMLASIITGTLGAGSISINFTESGAAIYTASVGEPVGALVAVLVGVEVGKFIENRTKFDLLIVPSAVVMSGGLVGMFVSPYISILMQQLGLIINELTMMQPLVMGILLGVSVGMILTLPISSAALCIAINITGLAAGAALAGCSAQMVGFAVSSFRENKVSGLISQGLGTSMLQMKNIIKNPWIWIPPTVASGVCGALSTIFQIETTSIGAGMGTSGLVGQFETYSIMGYESIFKIIILHFIMPAIISIVLSEILRKNQRIKFGDMQL